MTSDVTNLPIDEKKNFGSLLRSGLELRAQLFMTSQLTMGSLKATQQVKGCQPRKQTCMAIRQVQRNGRLQAGKPQNHVLIGLFMYQKFKIKPRT